MVCVGRLIAVCVCWLAVWLAGANSSHIPDKMKQSIKSLLEHYKNTELFNGTPVFSRDFLNKSVLEDSDRRVLMGGVLLVYEKMIGQMLEQVMPIDPEQGGNSSSSPAQPRQPEVEEQLRYLLSMVQRLKMHHYQQQAQLLQQLWNIQINNSAVQSKALVQFNMLYEEASSLTRGEEKKNLKRRRRRQTKRAKKPRGFFS